MAVTDIDQVVQGAPLLGLALFISIIAGKIAKRLGVPKVTAFIFVGILLGPSAFGILSENVMDKFQFINEIAFGLILFNIGGKFDPELFSKMQRKQIFTSLLFTFFIFISVFFLTLIASGLTSINLSNRVMISILLGIISVQSAPPTTLLVIKEYGAKGPLADNILVYLAISTILSLVFADVAIMFFQLSGYWQSTGASTLTQIGKLVWNILAPLPFGLLLGIILSYWEQKEKSQGEIYLAVITIILTSIGLSTFFHFSPLLTALFLGITVVNTSKTGKFIHSSIGEIGLSIYSLFFVFAGAHIHLQEQIKSIGLIGLIYIIVRIIGMMISSLAISKVFNESMVFGRNRGLSLLSHAGAALAIALKLKEYDEVSAQKVVSIIMSSIFIFELLGPFFLKYALKKSDEIATLGSKAKSTSKNIMSIKELVINFLSNIGILNSGSVETIHSIGDFIKRDVVAITTQANFAEITKFFEQYQFSIFPVVDENHRFEGLISMKAFKDAMLDKTTRDFTRAINLIGSKIYVPEEASFQEAIEIFNRVHFDTLPVINTQTRDLIGILAYKDVVMAMQNLGVKVSIIHTQT